MIYVDVGMVEVLVVAKIRPDPQLSGCGSEKRCQIYDILLQSNKLNKNTIKLLKGPGITQGGQDNHGHKPLLYLIQGLVIDQ